MPELYSAQTETADGGNDAPASRLDELLENGKKQTELARKQLTATRVCALLLALITAAMLFASITIVPRAAKLIDEATAIAERIDKLDVEALLENAETLLAETDTLLDGVEPLMDNINTMVLSAQDSMTEALETIKGIDLDSLNAAIAELGSLDIDTLNGAISDLAAIVEPLAKLFGK